jgi:hypothetical protein
MSKIALAFSEVRHALPLEPLIGVSERSILRDILESRVAKYVKPASAVTLHD